MNLCQCVLLCVLLVTILHQSPHNGAVHCEATNENKFDELLDMTSRGFTSSQVIEYNPRNLAIMTFLNSLLIVGGLIGTLRNGGAEGGGGGHGPFKRIDLSRWKRKFSFKKNKNIIPPSLASNGPSTLPVLPSTSGSPPAAAQLSPAEFLLPNAGDYLLGDAQLSRPFRSLLPAADTLSMRGDNIGGGGGGVGHKHAFRFGQSTSPSRVPLELLTGARRNDEIINEVPKVAQALPSLDVAAIEKVNPAHKCEHVFYCLDRQGKNLQRPHLSVISETASKLLNLAIGTREHPQLMQNVKELIEMEQKSVCVVNLVCPSSPNNNNNNNNNSPMP